MDSLLAEYAAHTGMLQLKSIDPDRDPGEVARLFERIGAKTRQMSTIVIETEDRSRILASYDLFVRRYEYRQGKRYAVRNSPPLFRGEEALTSAILAMSRPTTLTACFLVGHGERSIDDYGPDGLTTLRDSLKREGFTVSSTNLDRQSLPRCHILVQAGAKRDLSPDEQNTLRTYLSSGGKWLLMVEPWQTAGVEPILKDWGVEIRPVFLVDPASHIAGLGPTTLVVSRYLEHPITAGLSGISLILPYATSVRTTQTARELHNANLVLTSTQGIGKTDRNTRDFSYDKSQDRQGELAVAAAVDEPANLYSADGRREPARIVAVGDTHFATNAHIHRGANADFLLGAVDWLGRREDLIAVRAITPELKRVTLSSAAQSAVYWLSIGVLPGFVAILGGLVAWRRRS